MLLAKTSEIKIEVNNQPDLTIKNPLYYTKEELKKPYLNKKEVEFRIEYQNEIFKINCEQDYSWDGASIPFGFRWIIGAKGSVQFLIPSMVHDKLCENKELINYNRYLSSLIFKELLICYKVNKIKAQIMFIAVDNWQKLKRWQ